MPRFLRRSPLLSVVVPVYQVQAYLRECLDSILEQSYRHLEVVIVDDGSTDGSGDIAEDFASRDERVRVLRQANAGLGAARNVGVAAAQGRYLTFADSDDVVLPGAYDLMVATLERTRSDIAIGSVERIHDGRRFMTPLMRENHRDTRLRTSVREDPLVLADVFAWNKVFRRSFWDDTGLSFPEGVRYEDQPVLTRALVGARAFDVLEQPVYLWRVRDDGKSISQGRAELHDLADRMLTKRWSTDLVRQSTPESTQRVWFERILPIDMWEYFRASPSASQDYWDLLRSGMDEFWGRGPVPFERTGVPLRQRVMGWLVQQDRRADLERFLAELDDWPPPNHPFADEPGLPAELRPPAG